VGVIDEDAAGYKAWRKEFGAQFPVIFDKDKAIIKSYQAKASPWVVVVDTKGEMSTVHKGYSAKKLTELNALMARAGGVKAATINVQGAPTSEQFG
jgi:hypothetical protein